MVNLYTYMDKKISCKYNNNKSEFKKTLKHQEKS